MCVYAQRIMVNRKNSVLPFCCRISFECVVETVFLCFSETYSLSQPGPAKKKNKINSKGNNENCAYGTYDTVDILLIFQPLYVSLLLSSLGWCIYIMQLSCTMSVKPFENCRVVGFHLLVVHTTPLPPSLSDSCMPLDLASYTLTATIPYALCFASFFKKKNIKNSETCHKSSSAPATTTTNGKNDILWTERLRKDEHNKIYTVNETKASEEIAFPNGFARGFPLGWHDIWYSNVAYFFSFSPPPVSSDIHC